MLSNDLRDILRLYHGIKGGVRVDDHDRTKSAKAVAAGLNHGNFLFQALFLQFFFQRVDNLMASGGSTSSSAAD